MLRSNLPKNQDLTPTYIPLNFESDLEHLDTKSSIFSLFYYYKPRGGFVIINVEHSSVTFPIFL